MYWCIGISTVFVQYVNLNNFLSFLYYSSNLVHLFLCHLSYATSNKNIFKDILTKNLKIALSLVCLA